MEQLDSPKQIITVKNITFGFDRYSLSNENKDYLNQLYQDIEGIDLHLNIIGHSDSKGPSSYNVLLSKKRAVAVYNYLKSLGWPEEKMNTEGMGEKHIIAKERDAQGNDIPEGRKYNRRVELHFKELPNGFEISKKLDIPKERLMNE